ncbi:DUF6328 family protein [Actinokineospora bangkokensis]|uniref:Sodium:proton antiporter n=1 Tax=Actinokineospora bangkokensis TaxID=1193682 RepID=A0A1Q9LJJ5_9PSEU|nr:DUF6328 family protein [Actinokineospora bangkokensis]OLR92173.1 hypothetical protein BJP25_22845 [Actinokineospora bangkokensis]
MDTGETTHEKLTRNLNELLQELRVAQAGVQILFGFLLSITFTDFYHEGTGPLERTTHLVAVFFAVGAVVCLTAPAAWHRVLFRQGKRAEIMRMATRSTIAGLACLAGAVTASLALLAEVVIGPWAGLVAGAVCLVASGLLWFALPLARRDDGGSDDED